MDKGKHSLKLPSTVPVDDPEGLWELQLQLLEMAEEIFGPRDSSLRMYQPQIDKEKSQIVLRGLELCRPRFTDDGPQVNFDNKKVFAELSRCGERYWPTVLYELAHETIHLLNPVTLGTANYLEEGVCVAFSIEVQHKFDLGPDYCIQRPKKNCKYAIALSLVNQLPEPVLCSASKLRNKAGSLSDVTVKDLRSLYPDIDEALAVALTCKFSQPTEGKE